MGRAGVPARRVEGRDPRRRGVLLDDRKLAWALVAAAVVGHMFPVTRGVKGGKGVATTAGGAFVLQLWVAASLFVLWYAVLKLTRKASLASLAIVIGLPVGVAITGTEGWEIATIIAINALVFVRHLGNIKRLLTGRELSSQRQK